MYHQIKLQPKETFMPDNERVAVVTGSSRGIGRAIASRLAQDGLTMIVNYAGSASEAGRTPSRQT